MIDLTQDVFRLSTKNPATFCLKAAGVLTLLLVVEWLVNTTGYLPFIQSILFWVSLVSVSAIPVLLAAVLWISVDPWLRQKTQKKMLALMLGALLYTLTSVPLMLGSFWLFETMHDTFSGDGGMVWLIIFFIALVVFSRGITLVFRFLSRRSVPTDAVSL